MKKTFFLFILYVIAAVSLSAQSRIPKEAENWLQVTGQADLGGMDIVNVVFFEIPDTEASTLYFAVRSPETDGTNVEDDTTYGDGVTTTYTLIGGSGTLSDSKSRQLQYTAGELASNDHLTGTILHTQGFTNTYAQEWFYFPGVSPDQGEHIGNKYYFKVVTEAESGNGGKNGYQLDISHSSGGSPTGTTNVRTFAYSWMVALRGGSRNWDIYPFVPETDTGKYIVFSNWDFDLGGSTDPSGTAYNKTNAESEASSPGPITCSANNLTANTSYLIIAGEENGTWKAKYDEGTDSGFMNTSELWFWKSAAAVNDTTFYDVQPYRAYSSFFTPPPADHITSTYDDGLAVADGAATETVILQVVDSSGNPLPYSRDIYVTVSGSSHITSASNTSTALPSNAALVTTDSDGLAWIKTADGTVEVITAAFITDGTNGSSTLPGVNNSIFINFHPAGLGPLHAIKILDGIDGNAIDSVNLMAGETLNLYAGGYDANGYYRELVNVDWSSTGTLETIAATGTSFTFTPTIAGKGTIAVDDGAGHTDATGNINVSSAVLDHFTFTTQPPTEQMAGSPFSLTIEARDVAENLIVSFHETAAISDATESISPVTASFTNGMFSGDFTIVEPAFYDNDVITVTFGNISSESNSFNVIIAPFGIRNNIINPKAGDVVEIYFELDSATKVTARVFDLAGNLVKTLTNNSYDAGRHSFTWDGKSKGNRPCVRGIYFIVVRAGKSRKVYKVLVVR